MKTFKTSRGVEIEFLPIPTLLEKLQAQHRMPEPPTYEVKAATGAVELYPHDETTLEEKDNPEATAKNLKAWADYQAQLKAATEAFNLALIRLVMLRGIRVEMPEPNGWVKEQEYIGITVPDDPLERKIHWLETEALANEADYMAVVSGVMEASGVPEEVVSQAEATFRGKVGSNGTERSEDSSNGHELGDKPEVRASKGRHKERHTAHQ